MSRGPSPSSGFFRQKIKKEKKKVFFLSFRPSQSPSDDLGCFFRIEKVSGECEEVRIPVEGNSTRARSLVRARHIMQLLCNSARTRTFKATGIAEHACCVTKLDHLTMASGSGNTITKRSRLSTLKSKSRRAPVKNFFHRFEFRARRKKIIVCC